MQTLLYQREKYLFRSQIRIFRVTRIARRQQKVQKKTE